MKKTLEKAIDALIGASADTIEKDVLYWLTGEDVDTLDEAINLLENVSCEAGDVNHLVYTSDCINWVLEHEEAIIDFLNANIDDEVDSLDDISWEQHNQINSIITGWESGDDRVSRFNSDNWDEAEDSAIESIGQEEWNSLDEMERDDVIQGQLNFMLYTEAPLDIDKHDYVELAHSTFEYYAHVLLAGQLEGIKEVIEEE